MTSTLAGRCHVINLICQSYEHSFDSSDTHDGVVATGYAKLGFKFLDSLFLCLDGLGLLEVLLTQNRILTGHSLVLLNQVTVSLSQIVVSHNDILKVREKSLMEQLDGWFRLELDDHSHAQKRQEVMITTVAMDDLVVFVDVHVDRDEVNAVLSRLEEEIHTVFKIEVVAFLGIRNDEIELLVEILEDFLTRGVLL